MMRKFNLKYFTGSAVVLIILLLTACEYKLPESIWNEDENGAETPVILQVEPAAEAFAGASKIKITGTNFSDSPSDNVVYFDNIMGSIIFSSSSEIIVKPPFDEELLKDSLTITISVKRSYLPARYFPYKLKTTNILFGNFDGFAEQIFSIAVDKDENVYTMIKGRKVYKLDSEGNRDESWGTTTFPKASCMKFGPGGFLYLQKSNNQSIYRIPEQGGETEKWVTLSAKVRFFDFDQNDNLYTGGTLSGLFVVFPDGSFKKLDLYEEYDIKAVRVYSGYVYILADYKGADSGVPKTGIWKNQILDNKGNLSQMQLVKDWSLTGDFSSSNPFDLTFSENGDMYIGTDYIDPVLIVRQKGTMEPLYPGILKPAAESVVWGNREYLYINKTGLPEVRNLVRVDLAGNGAPYYGRN